MKRKKKTKKIAAAFRTRDHLITKPPPSPLGYLTIIHITVIKLLLIRLTWRRAVPAWSDTLAERVASDTYAELQTARP